jgi:hypothetical protein
MEWLIGALNLARHDVKTGNYREDGLNVVARCPRWSRPSTAPRRLG